MSKITKIIGGGIVGAILIIGGYYGVNINNNNTAIKVGIITDLSGPAAYWGESTKVGVEMAKQELESEGYIVDIVYEDYQLDAVKAVSAAQKLVTIDDVDAIYAEFNPAAIAVNSFVKDKNLLFMYDAAVTSPLKDNANAYKTYLDYQNGCKAIAQGFKDSGVEKIGMLKIKLEAGELCFTGVKEVYGDSVISEEYNLGDTDLKTQIVKLKANNIGAIINVGFEGDTMNTLKGIRELGVKALYGTVDDTITDNVKEIYAKELIGARAFGFKDVENTFANKLIAFNGNKKVASEYAAGLSYTHVKQIVRAVAKCEGDVTCVNGEMSESTADSTVGFKAFENRIADLEVNVKEY